MTSPRLPLTHNMGSSKTLTYGCAYCRMTSTDLSAVMLHETTCSRKSLARVAHEQSIRKHLTRLTFAGAKP